MLSPDRVVRDWSTITNGELAELSREEQAKYHVWLLNAWSAGAWSRAQRSHQADHSEALSNQDWTTS